MRRLLVLCMLLTGCSPSVVSLAPPEHITPPAPVVDPDLVSLCRKLETEHAGLLSDLRSEPDAAVRAVLQKAVTKAEAGLDTCRNEGAL